MPPIGDIEILRSKRGNPIVYHGGFVYTQHRLTDEKRIFRCESRDCKSRCHMNVTMTAFLQQPSCHSHAPNPNRFHVIRIQNEIKERSASCEEATSIILHNVLRSAPLSIAADLPSTNALSQHIRRQRPPILLDVNIQLPPILKQTDRGEDFVLFEDDSMIIFTSKSNLSVLKECKHWFCDGTFSVCPAKFFQLFTVHGLYTCQIVPLVYALLIGKKATDYDQLFDKLLLEFDFDPDSILLDFEQATINSITKLFPDAVQKGCLFHMGQCVWRHVQSIGLQNKYVNDETFRVNVNKLIALAFVPVDDVTTAYSSMIVDFDQDADKLLEYFEKTWVGQKKARGNRRTKPQFSVQTWNVYDRVLQYLPRSNNSVEGWHQAFNNRVSIKHPTVTKLANCILREQSNFEMDIERIRVGQQPKPQKKIYAIRDSRLKRIVASYNFESVGDYLVRVAANVKLNS